MREHGLTSTRFDEIRWVEETESTNADLVAYAKSSPDTGAVLFTDLQTAGRGRRDRRWVMSSGGGVLVSFYVPWLDSASLHIVPSALAVGAIETLQSWSSLVSVSLKWPNDVVAVVDGRTRKLAGMLSEVVLINQRPCGVVVGLGCNISWPTEGEVAAEPETLGRAVALETLTEAPVDRVAFGRELLAQFERELERAESLGTESVIDRWRSRCSTIGTDIELQMEGGSVRGRATDIDSDGALLVEVEGRLRRFAVGDVVHLRPGDSGD